MAVVISGRETEAPSISDITKVNSDFSFCFLLKILTAKAFAFNVFNKK